MMMDEYFPYPHGSKALMPESLTKFQLGSRAISTTCL